VIGYYLYQPLSELVKIEEGSRAFGRAGRLGALWGALVSGTLHPKISLKASKSDFLEEIPGE